MTTLFNKNQMPEIEKNLADYLHISSFQLMQNAGRAVFNYIKNKKNVLIVCGVGNNAGDGYIVAQLALSQGLNVSLWNPSANVNLPNDADRAKTLFLNSGGKITTQTPNKNYDCIVDAMFGTGLNRDVKGSLAKAINWINNQNSTIISIDIPSGLDADTGSISACAIKADITVCIICYKVGLFTNNGKNLCGDVFLEDLEATESIFKSIKAHISLLGLKSLHHPKFSRNYNTHKGSFGHIVFINGHAGMEGAIFLAAEAALRSGSGMVEISNIDFNSVYISLHMPELLNSTTLSQSKLLANAEVIAIGPGLGINDKSSKILKQILNLNKKLIIDADALTLLDSASDLMNNAILTPHPKEASKLLNISVEKIQADRVQSAQIISEKYNAVVVLKGSGTIIAYKKEVMICPFGYSGMASAGMGDVLTGIISSLIAQKFSLFEAAYIGVAWHALAAENCNKNNCLVASDVTKHLAKTLSNYVN